MGKLLFRVARLKIMGVLVGFALAYLPFLVPVKKIMQNKHAVAFWHPAAAYPDHALIIPRKVAPTAFDLTDADFAAVVEMATQMRKGDVRDFALVINSGARQDVMQAHFHLFTGNVAAQKGLANKVDAQFLLVNQPLDFHSILQQYNVPKVSFSIIMQFEGGNKPAIYLT
jgi:diadenosine tetraphosphate (Ap4A) HIT family hydrolase